jgi:pyroglutamyl-peptidase
MSSMPPILLCAFEPFGGESVNGSGEVARALDGRVIDGAPVVGLELPCVFGRSLDVLRDALAAHRPQLVLALGQAGGRCDVTVERVAINVNDARIADNAGARPIDIPVIAGAPAAYFSTLPIKAIVAALRSAGLPASVSQSAGTYVCNHVFYGLMHALAGMSATHPVSAPVRGGFIHLPLLPEQAARLPGQPSLPLALGVDAVALALRVALTTHEDLRESDGSLS